MRAVQLVLQHGADEALVEEARGPVDDVQRLGLGLVDSDPAAWAEVGSAGEEDAAGGAVVRAGRTTAKEIAKRHRCP